MLPALNSKMQVEALLATHKSPCRIERDTERAHKPRNYRTIRICQILDSQRGCCTGVAGRQLSGGELEHFASGCGALAAPTLSLTHRLPLLSNTACCGNPKHDELMMIFGDGLLLVPSAESWEEVN